MYVGIWIRVLPSWTLSCCWHHRLAAYFRAPIIIVRLPASRPCQRRCRMSRIPQFEILKQFNKFWFAILLAETPENLLPVLIYQLKWNSWMCINEFFWMFEHACLKKSIICIQESQGDMKFRLINLWPSLRHFPGNFSRATEHNHGKPASLINVSRYFKSVCLSYQGRLTRQRLSVWYWWTTKWQLNK